MQPDLRTLCGLPADPGAPPAARWLLLAGALASLLPWTPPWAALLAGTGIALLVGNPCAVATARLSRQLLPIAVTGLGAGVNLAIVARVGLQGLGYTFIGLLATFALGAWLARRAGVAPKLAALICAGTGICGGSAIAAAAPAIGASNEETSAALATIFTLNAVALLVFPPLGVWFGLDAHQFGLWCALAIHDTSSVTGAALTHGADALATATTVKLARTLWIVPVALALGAWAAQRDGTGHRGGVRVPWFIAGFALLSAVFTFLPAMQPLAPAVSRVVRSLLTLTLFLIGAGLSREVLCTLGLRPLLHALLLWVVIGGVSLAAILARIIA
jgi:uncharacterized integral membrane protein (TIGR00698 family)